MSLVKHCQPFLEVVCRYHRLGRHHAGSGRDVTMNSVREKLSAVLDRLADEARADPSLWKHWEWVEAPLLYFADGMIGWSELPCAAQWRSHGMAADRRQLLAGDSHFFDLLDEVMSDHGPDATARLEILYLCLALGFAGKHRQEPGRLEQRIQECRSRLGRTTGRIEKVTPDVLEHTDTRRLTQNPARPISMALVAFLGLFIMLFLLSIGIYQRQIKDLNTVLGEIQGIPLLEDSDTTTGGAGE